MTGRRSPLLGSAGLTPVTEVLGRAAFRQAPSLFHWRYSDRLAVTLGWLGLVLAALVVVGLPQSGPTWLTMLTFAVLWALYLSYINVGRIWYAFGWESLLCEAGFLAIFLGSTSDPVAWPVLLGFRWLLFRVEFGAGLIKIRGDHCWRDLTCLHYHHETQPLPGPFSWWFHRLPRDLHRVEVAANHVTQLVLPFGLFLPQPVAGIAGVAVLVTQGWLVVSGNFAWLNLVTMVLALAALPDEWLVAVLPIAPGPAPGDPAGWYVAVVLLIAAVLLALSWRPTRNLLSRYQKMNASFEPLRLVNTYGAFGAITRVRYEIIIEGTADPNPGPDSEWRAYELPAKPGDPHRRPRQVAPYHLRLDWLLWFAAMSPTPHGYPWFAGLLVALLRGDAPVRSLFAHDPFPDEPPTAVRARRYRYRYTTRQERRETGAWWHRELVGEYVRTVRREEVAGT